MESIQDTTQINGNFTNVNVPKTEDEPADVQRFRDHVDEVVVKVDEFEQKVNDVAEFYTSLSKKQLNISKVSSAVKEKNKERHFFSIKRQQQEAAKREAASAKRMQELIRQFGTIFRQVIDKPMDFTTIKNQIEAKDGAGYKNVREICADVRLVFKNAMTYNDDRNDVHVMAKTLLAKFEEKWLLLLPRVIEEETRRKEEEAEARLGMQLAQEAANVKLARHISNELGELEAQLDELREIVVEKCRKMSVAEKRKLGAGLSKFSPEDLTKALEIIAQKNPSFQVLGEEVDIDMDAQSESTLWRLKFFVKGALEAKSKDSETKVGNDNNKRKREICDAKREICDALAKTAKKRSKKLAS